MHNPKYTYPFPELPIYERCIVRLRALELTLVLYYAEEIRRTCVDLIRTSEQWRKRRDAKFIERVPEGTKRAFEKALNALVADGAISGNEKNEIVAFTDFRNNIGHRVDQLFSDMEQTKYNSLVVDDELRKEFGVCEFDHGAAERMRKMLRQLSELSSGNGYILTFRNDGHMMFSTTENSLVSDIDRLKRRLKNLADDRKRELEEINRHLKTGFNILQEKQDRRFFDIRFEDGPMTKRGQELCYLFFDVGISQLAVAHIFEMKLPAIRKRFSKWIKLGGIRRSSADFNSIPVQISRSRFDD